MEKSFTSIIANKGKFMRASTTGLAPRQPENLVMFTSGNRDGVRFTVSVLEVLGSADRWKLKAAFQLCQWGVIDGAPNTSMEWYDVEEPQKAFMLPEGDFNRAESTIENRAVNPVLETDAAGWGQRAGTGGSASGEHVADGSGYQSMNYRSMVWTAPTTAPSGGMYGARTPVTPGVPVTVGLAVRASKDIRGRFGIMWDNNTIEWQPSQIVPANSWVYGGITATPPIGRSTGTAIWEASGEDGVDGAANWQIGDELNATAHLVADGEFSPRYVSGTEVTPAEEMLIASGDDAFPLHRSRVIRGFGELTAIRMWYETVNPSSDFGLVLSITAV